MRTIAVVALVFVIVSNAGRSPAHASLAGSLDALSAAPDVFLSDTRVFTKGEQVADVLTPQLQTLLLRGIDFPLPPTAPGFVYSYDPQLQALTRSKSLGPAFSERPQTVGRGRFDVGGSFLYGDLDSVDGGGFGTSESLFVDKTVNVSQGATSVDLPFRDLTVNIRSFSLKSSQFNFTATYGITDRWDVNVLLPLIYNTLDVHADQTLRLLADPGASLTAEQRQLIPAPLRIPVHVEDDAFGPGDLFLRTKYRLLDEPLSLAGGLVVRFPSGDTDNFFGLGDYIVTPFLVGSKLIGPPEFALDLHGSIAIDADASNLSASRARYSLGAVWQFGERFALLSDLIGSSGLADDSFDVKSSVGVSSAYNGIDTVEAKRAGNQFVTTYTVARYDIIDLAMGVKVAVSENGTAFLGAVIPVNNSGVRADVIPTGGIEFNF